MPTVRIRMPRTLALVLAASAALALSAGSSASAPVADAGGRQPSAPVRLSAAGADADEKDGPRLRVVGAWNGSAGERALRRDRVSVGDVIVAVQDGPATLERWQTLMREIGRTFYEDMGGEGREGLRVHITLSDGSVRQLEVLGTSRTRDGSGWRYGAYTGAQVAAGADAPLLPVEREVPPPPREHAEPVEQPLSPYCREILARFGPRPDGAPCWWLERSEQRQLTEEQRQQAIADPDGQLPWRTDWAFHAGAEGLVPPHRVPSGYGYEEAPDWVAAGAYHTSQVLLDCRPGSSTRLLGSVRAGAWAAHAVGCLDAAGQQTSGALIYAQPDPGRCGGSPWLWDSCGTGRLVLLNVVQPSDGMRPDLDGVRQQEVELRLGSLDGRWNLVLPSEPYRVPYLAEKALPVG